MKRTVLFLVFISAFLSSAVSKQVDSNTAKIVGQNFFKKQDNIKTFGTAVTLTLNYTSVSNPQKKSGGGNNNYFYIFNINENEGFIIVSADDNVNPVLAYSDEKAFDSDAIPVQVSNWLESYSTEIDYIIENKISATKEIAAMWIGLLNGKFTPVLHKKGSVNPLVKTKWNQSTYYNQSCPYDNNAKVLTYTGCVATAMSQVMKFWNYPAIGSGSHRYNHDYYGTLSAYFGAKAYDWGSMPNSVSSSNNAVATLMYHCGVSVDMNYGTVGSGAYVISSGSPTKNCSEYAFKNYFGYKASLQGVLRSNYSETNWVNLMKSELDNGRPVLYSGFQGQDGHAFIADGYDNNNYLHFNWGWGGSSDGYFTVNSLNPSSSNNSYNENQSALIGIEPDKGNKMYNLDIISNVWSSKTNPPFADSFTVYTNIKNNGADTFKGKFCAAIYDRDNIFVRYLDSVEDKTGLPKAEVYKTGLKFYYPGGKTLLPADYTVCIFYKSYSGDWKLLGASDTSIDEIVKVRVESPTQLMMTIKEMSISPTELSIGKPASVNLSIANTGPFAFLGLYRVCLFNLDGTFAEEIGSYSEYKGLMENQYYGAPYLTFKTEEIKSAPGSYLLGLQSKANWETKWSLISGILYTNPVKVKVVDKRVYPDKYEINDDAIKAYSLPLKFTNDTAFKATDSANCHTTIDYDYYKFDLPKGYNYSIRAKLQDLNYADNGKLYSVNAFFAYSLNGTSWSQPIDTVLNKTININNGGKIYFMVYISPSDEPGTYSLDFNITRKSIYNSSANITGFIVSGIIGKAQIDTVKSSVSLEVNSSTDISAMTPTITVSEFAKINPGSQVIRNFTSPVNYTVTAQDGSFKNWKVTVTKEPADLSEIINSRKFTISPNPANTIINIEASIVHFNLPYIITDQIGKQIQKGELSNKTNTVDISSLASGLYFLQIGEVNKEVFKIMKQ